MGRVFLSHSSLDKPFVRQLHRRLTRDGINCFFDEENIEWGDNWVLTLESAIKECSQIVFVLTPDFCNSKWAQIERTSAMTGLNKKLLPLTLHPCSHLDTYPQFLKQIQTTDVSTDALFEQNYPKICRKLGGTPTIERTTTDRSTLPPIQKLPAHHRMPFRSLGDNFIGRTADLWSIHDALHNGGTAIVQGVSVVAGTGGLGKTQAAIEYAYRFGTNYPGGVYWVDADRGLSTLITQVSDAAQIDLNTKAPEDHQLAELWQALNTRAASLLVLDNFPEKINIQPYLPKAGTVHTLVTTRRRDLYNFPQVRLNLLTGAPGEALLNSGQRKFPPAEAASLVERLGGLPLALELTKSFLNYRTDATVAQVLAQINKKGDVTVLSGFAKQYGDELPSGHEPDVAQTFQLSWDLAPEAAQNVLRVMADLAPVGVPRSLIRAVLELPEASDLDDPLSEAISELVRLSLVELDSNNNPVIHRLILGFVTFRNQADGVSLFERKVAEVNLAMRATESEPGAPELQSLELHLPHAEVLLADDRLAAREAMNLLGRTGQHHRAMGRFSLARHFWEEALAKAEEHLPPNDSFIASRQSNLALVLKDLGELEPARDLLTSALASDEKNFLPGHDEIATKQSNLATVLLNLGELEPARDLLTKALASAKKTFPPGHRSIAIRQSNLALVLRALGELKPARDLLTRALASDEKNFPPGHPSMAIGQSNLAGVLQDLGKLKPARRLLTKALASDEKNFPAGHPALARSQSNLAMVLKDLGELEPARYLLARALTSLEANYTPTYPLLITVRNNLAHVLRAMGRTTEADQLDQKTQAAQAGT